MTHQKKFQDFMVDARIPSSWRDRVPIVYTPDQIIWVVGYRIDDRVKINKSTKKVITIIFERIEESDCGFRA
jgi:tRNA(Ile)-lysidine synthase